MDKAVEKEVFVEELPRVMIPREERRQESEEVIVIRIADPPVTGFDRLQIVVKYYTRSNWRPRVP